MSFLEEIKNRNVALNPVQTRITRTDGRVYLETFGRISEDTEGSNGSGIFFVVDTKPDDHLHEVISNLFIGSQDAACNFDSLKDKKITHILNVGGAILSKLDKITYKYMPLYDRPDFKIKAHFADAVLFIKDGLKNGSVLVHCNAGISRSSTIIMAYLMTEKGLSLDASYQIVKKGRSIAKPNPGFMQQLKLYEKELRG